MKSLFSVLLGFFLLLTGNVALAQISDLNSAINKAGRQRMLSQRMAKAYFQIGQQVEVGSAQVFKPAAIPRQTLATRPYNHAGLEFFTADCHPAWPVAVDERDVKGVGLEFHESVPCCSALWLYRTVVKL